MTKIKSRKLKATIKSRKTVAFAITDTKLYVPLIFCRKQQQQQEISGKQKQNKNKNKIKNKTAKQNQNFYRN